MESWRTELYHYGIKGQQWGVRRGPPYPIGGGDYTPGKTKEIGKKKDTS